MNNLILTLRNYALSPLGLRLLLLGGVVDLSGVLDSFLIDELLGVLLVCQFLMRRNVYV